MIQRRSAGLVGWGVGVGSGWGRGGGVALLAVQPLDLKVWVEVEDDAL